MRLLAAAAAWCARARTTPADVALAAGVTVLVVSELGHTVRWPVAVGAVTVPVLLGLAWRRRRPLGTAVAVLGLAVLLSAVATGPFPPQLVFLAQLLAVYTVAAETAGRRAAVGGALALALVTAAHLVSGDGDAGDFLPLLVWGAPWTAGRLVRRRTLEAAAQAHRAAVVVEQAQEQEREAVAAERDRIARELHDVVAHGVSLMVVQAGAERLRLGDAGGRTTEVLADVERAGRSALAELRTMLGVLRAPEVAPGLAPQPALDDLPALVAQVRAAGLPVVLDAGPLDDVPPGLGLSAYRVVQEALTNVLKHAPGAATSVRAHVLDGALALEVRSALPRVPAQPGRGRGLVGIAERAALHGGTASTGPEGEEWVVRVALPVPSAAPAP